MSIKNDLSTNISNFKKLINRGKIYVDKTDIIEKIISLGETYYFLSRPRRFRKSLFLSTFKELFKGNKELFKGLYIYDKWDWNKTYPVIHIDLNEVKSNTAENFEKSLNFLIDSIAKNKFSIKLEAEFSNNKLTELINNVYTSTDKNVVVLIDEYDKPILSNIDNKELAISIRQSLKDFYGALKSADSKLEFVFITGVTKFSKVSLFSDLNNLTDLTLKNDFSTICGYTQEEIENYFKAFFVDYANLKNISYSETVDKIKYHYDGYSWDGENFLYNPYSVLNFFDDYEFKNYWFESGTPNFLVKIFKKNLNIESLYNPIKLHESNFSIFDIENIKQIPLLFQSGYLTMVKKETFDDEIIYTLKIPNFEVETSITRNLLENFYEKAENNFMIKRKEILTELREGKCNLFVKYLKKEIMGIYYQLKIRNWRYYQTIVYFAIKGLNVQTEAEIGMFTGRMDIAIEEKDNNYSFTDNNGYTTIIELKYTQMQDKNTETLAKTALNKRKEKEYYEKYDYENLTLIGLAIKEVKLKVGTKIDIKCKIEKIDSSI